MVSPLMPVGNKHWSKVGCLEKKYSGIKGDIGESKTEEINCFCYYENTVYSTSGTITRPKVRQNRIMLMPYIHRRKIK